MSNDCRITLEVAVTSERNRTFRWITRRGKAARLPLHSGWLTVQDALKRPLPDTSWMENPWPRKKFTAWLG
ncbi:MAG: hypothetical protein J7M24_03405 [Candidatus Latescibacteria bacterium]|nr:hypothetical protein [Candidatus Latescibacterota bacterium]